ncbi:MAG: FtsH protease activity modulator HflK [Lentisphaerae bacterium]|nr:FtsH protease activity modulator HflK [Lentisphaerota bacterium]MCP4100820.1 FtsH protease activity modulator HflK [Lentisphaerota bacterium]
MQQRTPEDAMRELKENFGGIIKYLPYIILISIIAIILINMIYSIGPDEVGVVQRFGKYHETTTPGLHVKIPFGIDKVTPVKIQRIFKEEFGTRTIAVGNSTQSHSDESLMLTGDLNILDVKWIVQFRVKDPVQLLFATRDPVTNLRNVAEIVMRRLVGDYTVDEVLTTKREEIDVEAQLDMQNLLEEYNTGLKVVTVKLLDVNPPNKVKPAFNEVNEAKQEKEQAINQAWEAYNKVIPKARGEAKKTIREAEGYSLDKINRAKGDADRFLAVLAEYNKAPEITKKRIYIETMSEVIPMAKQKYVMDPTQSSILPLLNIGQKVQGDIK